MKIAPASYKIMKPEYTIPTVPMCYADMITILEDIRKNETIKNEERLSGLDRVISELKFECDLENHLY